MRSDRAAKIRALMQRHGRLRIFAGWTGWASTPDPEVVLRIISEWPAGTISTTAGRIVITWRNHDAQQTEQHASSAVTDARKHGRQPNQQAARAEETESRHA